MLSRLAGRAVAQVGRSFAQRSVHHSIFAPRHLQPFGRWVTGIGPQHAKDVEMDLRAMGREALCLVLMSKDITTQTMRVVTIEDE